MRLSTETRVPIFCNFQNLWNSVDSMLIIGRHGISRHCIIKFSRSGGAEDEFVIVEAFYCGSEKDPKEKDIVKVEIDSFMPHRIYRRFRKHILSSKLIDYHCVRGYVYNNTAHDLSLLTPGITRLNVYKPSYSNVLPIFFIDNKDRIFIATSEADVVYRNDMFPRTFRRMLPPGDEKYFRESGKIRDGTNVVNIKMHDVPPKTAMNGIEPGLFGTKESESSLDFSSDSDDGIEWYSKKPDIARHCLIKFNVKEENKEKIVSVDAFLCRSASITSQKNVIAVELDKSLPDEIKNPLFLMVLGKDILEYHACRRYDFNDKVSDISLLIPKPTYLIAYIPTYDDDLPILFVDNQSRLFITTSDAKVVCEPNVSLNFFHRRVSDDNEEYTPEKNRICNKNNIVRFKLRLKKPKDPFLNPEFAIFNL